MKKAVVLLSGGLDSATCLAIAKAEGFSCYALSFDYGQHQVYEIKAAKEIASLAQVVEHRVVRLDIGQFGGSALTDAAIDVPNYNPADTIPVTYVPARNTTFLAIALGYAEVIGAFDIFIGANVIDYSGYPDCRPEFIHAFETLANLATCAGVAGHSFTIQAPLLELNKQDIINKGVALGVDYGLTVSCYRLNHSGEACGRCDSCVLRATGFIKAGKDDPTRYVRSYRT